MSLNFFDSFARIGRGAFRHPPPETPRYYEGDVETLLETMEYFDIADALVFHITAQEGSARFGNKLLMPSIEAHSNLHPCWVLSPHVIREADEPENLLRAIKANDVRAVRLYPGAAHTFGYPFNEVMCGALLSALERERIPVFLPSFEALDASLSTTFENLHQILGNHPEFPIVVNSWGVRTYSYRLLELHPNLYLETGLLCEHEALEFVCRKFGAERLIFGTRFGQSPFTCAGGAITNITMAPISGDEKQMIAGGNLRRLLNLPPPEPRQPKVFSSVFVQPLREGKPIESEVIIDAHAHNAVEEMLIPDCDPDNMVGVMDRLGFDKACITSPNISGANTKIQNDLMTAAVRAHPDRFIGYTKVDPHFPERIPQELETRLEQDGIRHIKVHPHGHNYPVTGENYRPAWEWGSAHGSVVLAHTTLGHSTCSPSMFAELAQNYPDVTFLIGHSGNDRDGYKESVEAALKHENLYLETCGWCATSLGALEYMVEKIGADRILFGTDFVWIGAPFQLGAIAYANISDEDKRKIFGLNAMRLFGLSAM